ncbi:Tripartite motif-containing protein 2, partial [Taenia solium]
IGIFFLLQSRYFLSFIGLMSLYFVYDDPYTLPCLHTFCRRCITGWLNVNTICPKCREHYSIADLKQFFEFNEMVNCARTGDTTFCEECKMPAASPVKCDHCAKSMCSACYTRHTVEVREEVRRLCVELISVTMPKLVKHSESAALLLSEVSSAKEELQETHRLLVDQIDKAEAVSNQNLNTQIEDIDSLIARIDSFSTASTETIEKGVSLIGSKGVSAVGQGHIPTPKGN